MAKIKSKYRRPYTTWSPHKRRPKAVGDFLVLVFGKRKKRKK